MKYDAQIQISEFCMTELKVNDATWNLRSSQNIMKRKGSNVKVTNDAKCTLLQGSIESAPQNPLAFQRGAFWLNTMHSGENVTN